MKTEIKVDRPGNENIARLKALMIAEIDGIDQIGGTFRWNSKPHYLEWLAQTYYYVAHTTRLLALAASKTPLSKEWIYGRFVREIHEENGHELLLVRDLKTMGHKPSDFSELPETAFFYQTLSYLITHESPLSILGYSLTLEGLSALKTDNYYNTAKDAFGVDACQFLRVHSEVDKTHFSDGLIFLDKCGGEEVAAIEKGIRQCGVIYRNILSAIQRAVEKAH